MSRLLAVSLVAVVVFLMCVPASLNGQTTTSDHYKITLIETGLPNDTRWFASIGTFTQYSNNGTISFYESNGTYNITIGGNNDYKPLPNTFKLTVRGSNVSQVIVWVPVLYSVTFIESGLPSGTFWNVTLGNDTNVTSNITITFHVKNGTYNYSIPDVIGIASSTPNGTITVKGGPTKVFVEFTLPVTFTFYEQGLPSGAMWSIFINGSYYNTTSSHISVTLSNGTYSYLVVVPPNYNVNPTHGKVNYSDNLVFINATSLLIYEVAIAVLILLVGIFTSIYLRARKRINSRKNKEVDPEKGK